MSFRGTDSQIGRVEFNVIDVDIEQIAKGLQKFVERGSKLTGVSLDDIDTRLMTDPPADKDITLARLLECGMKLFDALVWLTAGRPASHPLTRDPSITKESLPSMHEIASAVFYCYFFLLTQARYPVVRGGENPPRVPNFLKVVMGLTDNQSEYVARICSFNPVKFDARWVKHVKFEGLGQEALSRFGLGVAGYRMFTPFKLYPPKAGVDDSLGPAFAFARSIASSPPTWGIHPLTRSPEVLTKRGNLNKNLGNLILEVFSDEDIDEMVKAKVLYSKPVKEPNYRNYKSWRAPDDVSGNDTIFDDE